MSRRKNTERKEKPKKGSSNRVSRRNEDIAVSRTPIWNKKPLKPMNDKQLEYINMIKNHKLVCSMGVAGSGKSYIAAVMAADMLLDPGSSIEKLVIARPNQMEGTQSIGLLPGTLEEKLGPWLVPVTETLKERLGNGHFEAFVENGKIEFLPLEMIKGRTFNNTFIIIDEAEDIEWSVLKTVLLRIGKDSKMVIDGDVRQESISSNSGLRALIKLNEDFYLPMGFIDFDSWELHCIRSEECRLFGQIFEQAGV